MGEKCNNLDKKFDAVHERIDKVETTLKLHEKVLYGVGGYFLASTEHLPGLFKLLV